MKLEQVKLKNFRGYRDEISVDFDNLTVFVGKNDVGKSTILEALDVFFNKTAPDLEDACVSGDKSDVCITCIFSELPESLVLDSINPTTLTDEYLLNVDGHLEVLKRYDCSGASAKKESVFITANHPTASGLENLLSLTPAKLKALASKQEINLSGVNQTKSADLRRAIWSGTHELNLTHTDLPVAKGEGKDIWDQLKKELPVYALFKSDRPSTDQDEEAQDPMNIAIKQAIQEQERELANVTEEIRKKVQEVADRTVSKIQDFSPELASQLKPRVITKKWESLFKVDLSDEGDVPINKRGSGVRRLVLLSFFRAQAEKAAEGHRKVLYAIEEPETSQHPNNQKMLAEAFADLIEMQACQVLLTTHTPVLARCFNQNTLRFVTNVPVPAVLPPIDDTLQKIVDTLGVLPDHSVKVFFGVEGRQDINALRAISSKLHVENSEIPDLAAHEDAGTLVFIPMGGSSLDLWINRVKGLNRPQFYLMDRDVEPPAPAKYQKFYEQFIAEGHTAWITNKLELENYISVDLIKAELPNYTGTGADFDDVPNLFAKAVHENSESPKSWDEVLENKESVKKKESSAKRRLNEDIASKMTLEKMNQVDPDGELIGYLKVIGQALSD